MMKSADSPRILAAATYSRSRSSRVNPRTMRAMIGAFVSVSTPTMFQADEPNGSG